MSEANVTVSRHHKPRQTPASRGWRPAKRCSSTRAAISACPVADLACEGARLLRLHAALDADEVTADQELLTALTHPDDFVRPDELRTELSERIRAVAALAAHRRPTSLKGAIFQLYVAASEAQATSGMLSTKISFGEQYNLQKRDRKIERLHRSALAHLETLAMDDDLAILREHWFTHLYDAHAGCERAMHDPKGLIADALGAKSTWKEHVASSSPA